MTNRSGLIRWVSVGVLLAAAGAFVWNQAAGKRTATPTARQGANIYQTIAARGNLKTLVKALDAAGLKQGIQGPGPFTLLAPTDEAFAKLPPGKLASLLKPSHREKLAEILVCHVLPGKVSSAKLRRLRLADSFHGTTLLFRTVNGKIFVDEAKVLTADIPASNGVIHVIDRVLEPKDILAVCRASGQCAKLLAAVKAAGMTDLLKARGREITFFAPTDEAFSILPPGTLRDLLVPANKHRLVNMLKHHVVCGRGRLKGGKLTPLTGPPLKVTNDDGVFLVNGANVLLENIKATNGMVNVIDHVLIPPAGGTGK